MGVKWMLVSVAAAAQLFAFSMDDAVKSALENSYSLQSKIQSKIAEQKTLDSLKANFRPSVDASYAYNSRNEAVSNSTKENSTFSLAASYNLFNGYTDRFNKHAQSATVNSKQDEIDAAKEDIKLNVKVAYLNYLKSKDTSKIEAEGVELLEKQLLDAKVKYEQGIIAKNELLEIRVQQNSAKQALLSAKSSEKIAFKTLQRQVLTKIKESEVQSIDFSNAKTLDSALFEEKMFENRSEIKTLEKQRKSLLYTKKALMGADLPSVDLSATYYRAGDEAYPDGVNGGQEDEVRFGVSVAWNLYDGGSRESQEASYLAQMNGLNEDIKDLKETLKLQLSTALENYDLAVNQKEVASLGVEQAQENYRIVNNQYKEGVSDTTTLLDARNALTRAKRDLNSARYDILDSFEIGRAHV